MTLVLRHRAAPTQEALHHLWQRQTVGGELFRNDFFDPTTSAQIVQPAGLVSAEAFGAATVALAGGGAQTVVVTGIVSAEAFGANLLTSSYLVSPSAIASAEAFGTQAIKSTYLVTATGVASAETFGTHLLTSSYLVAPSAIASAEAFGAQVLKSTYLVSPSAIASAEAFGAHLLTSSYLVAPSAIASAEAFGAHVLTSTYLVTATSIATGEAFGSAVVTLSGGGTQTVAPAGIVTGEQLGTPALLATVSLSPSGIPSGETFGSATVKASYTLTMNGLASGEAFGMPNVAIALRIEPLGIGSEEAIGIPSLDGQLVLGTDVLNIIAQVMFEALGFVSVDTPTRATLETSTSSAVGLQILATRMATVVVFQEISAEAATYSEGNLMTTVVRGNTVTFKANFTDDARLPINPAQAAVFVSFPNPTGSRTTIELALTQSGNDWTAQWDSGVSKPGTVSWSAQTKATTPAAAVDGTFEVTANSANPESLA